MSEIVTAYHDAMSHKSPDALADLYAEDGLHEFPFGGLPPYQGRERIRDGYRASWGTSPAEVQEIRNVLIHHSTDPEVLVVEQETVVKVGDRSITVPGLLILRIRDGLIVHTRDYMDATAIAGVRAAA
ncbi:nuclear transport factor 2 family protein [Nonomuraea glycinis]|uniref:nuclear transport factor 2 family protein n=1 Tax=Nonomuraea glycinis TaxID=2047744 RepID=UPI002E0FC288|nr:nuclear transport factor 2 family protein [Nonomuraea glycinis]